MNKSNIVNQFTPKMPKEQLKILELFDILETKEERQINYIDNLDKQILKKFNILKEKLEQCSLKVNTAIFGDKKFINESYAYEIPINKDYFEDNINVKFEDNILTNTLSKASKSNRTELDIRSITSRKNTKFNFKNKTLNLEKNDTYDYQEIQINLPKNITAGTLHLEFNKYDNISLLNKYGKEIVQKSITNNITQPISKDTEALIVRFNSNEEKFFNIQNFYISENSFNLESMVYSKPIGIYQDLKEIGINTCDNYSEDTSDIKYEISINKGNYREIRPLNKQKNLNLFSILSVDDKLTYYKLEDSIYHDNIRLYTTEHFENQTVNLINSFKYKLGEDLGLIPTEDFFSFSEKDIQIVLKENSVIYINGNKTEALGADKEVILKKGFNELKVPEDVWNQDINLLRYKVLNFENNLVTLELKEDKSIVTKVTDYALKDSLFLQMVLKSDIFVEKTKEKPYYANGRFYITKTSNNSSHVFIKFKTNYVETIQLKITLKSLTKTNPVYISSITIRGI